VAKYTEASGEERLPLAVALDLLVEHKLDDRLSCGQSSGFHVAPFLTAECHVSG
jgi:hypothetical protein